MEEMDNAGDGREKRTDVGPGRPPKDKQFSSTNQPSTEARRRGKLKKKFAADLAQSILQMAFTGAVDGELKKKIALFFKVKEKDITIEMMMIFRQMEKAINRRDTMAFQAVMDRAYGKPKIMVENTGNLPMANPTVLLQMPEGVNINLPSNTEGEE